MLRTSSSTTSTFLPTSASSERCNRSSILCFSPEDRQPRDAGTTPFHRAGVPATRHPSPQRCGPEHADEHLLPATSSLPVKTTTGKSPSEGLSRKRSNTSKPDISGKRRSRTTQSKGCSITAGARLPGGNDCDINVVIAEQFLDAELFGRIVFYDQQPFSAGRGYSLMREKAVSSPRRCVGLLTNANAPRARPWCRSSSSVSIWTGI